jgi:hypothetical protein
MSYRETGTASMVWWSEFLTTDSEDLLEDLLGRKSSGSGLEIREYGRKDPSRWPRGTLYP